MRFIKRSRYARYKTIQKYNVQNFVPKSTECYRDVNLILFMYKTIPRKKLFIKPSRKTIYQTVQKCN